MRGMIKWQPFKSLTGQYELLDERRREKNETEKPVLSSDQMEEINSVLTTLEKDQAVDVTYFENGEIRKKKAHFFKCDPYLQRVYFRDFQVPFDALLGLQIS